MIRCRFKELSMSYGLLRRWIDKPVSNRKNLIIPQKIESWSQCLLKTISFAIRKLCEILIFSNILKLQYSCLCSTRGRFWVINEINGRWALIRSKWWGVFFRRSVTDPRHVSIALFYFWSLWPNEMMRWSFRLPLSSHQSVSCPKFLVQGQFQDKPDDIKSLWVVR